MKKSKNSAIAFAGNLQFNQENQSRRSLRAASIRSKIKRRIVNPHSELPP